CFRVAAFPLLRELEAFPPRRRRQSFRNCWMAIRASPGDASARWAGRGLSVAAQGGGADHADLQYCRDEPEKFGSLRALSATRRAVASKKRKEVNATDQGSKPCPLSPEPE